MSLPLLSRRTVITRTVVTVPVAAGSVTALAACSGPAEPDAAGSGAAPATRTIEHVYGTTEVPVDPQRVVCLDGDLFLEPTLALGIPVLAAGTPGTGQYSPQIEERLPAGFHQMANKAEVDLEEVLALDPDLVVVPTDGDALPEVYAQLRTATAAVGPTYGGLSNWRETLRSLGGVFGRQDVAENLLAGFETHLQEVAAALPDDVGTLSIVRVRPDGRVSYLPSVGTYPWTVFGPLGLSQPAQQDRGDEDSNNVFVSLEELPLLDADTLLVLLDGGTEDGFYRQLEELSSWRSLAGRKVVVDSAGWLFGNVLTADAVLDRVRTVLYPA